MLAVERGGRPAGANEYTARRSIHGNLRPSRSHFSRCATIGKQCRFFVSSSLGSSWPRSPCKGSRLRRCCFATRRRTRRRCNSRFTTTPATTMPGMGTAMTVLPADMAKKQRPTKAGMESTLCKRGMTMAGRLRRSTTTTPAKSARPAATSWPSPKRPHRAWIRRGLLRRRSKGPRAS